MLIGIVGDTHFGAGINLGRIDAKTQIHTRLLDYTNTLIGNIDFFVKKGVEIIIFTGDIFEHRQTTNAQQQAFAKCIQYALDAGLEIIIVMGNHDEQRSINATTIDIYKTLKLNKVHVYTDFGRFDYKNFSIFLMPFRDRKHFSVSTNKEALNIIKEKLDVLGFSDPNIKNKIVVGHYFFEGGIFTSDEEYSVSLNEIYIPIDFFNHCSAVVFGHIHKGEYINKNPPMIYSGSIDRNSFGERDYDKCVVIIDTDNFSKTKLHKRPVRDLFDIKIDYSEKQIESGKVLKQILAYIDAFAEENNLNGSIARISVKIDESALYTINESILKDYLYSKGINYCSSVSISSFLKHTKKSEIVELTDSKKIIASYVNSLKDEDTIKKDMVEFAEKIINDVDAVG